MFYGWYNIQPQFAIRYRLQFEAAYRVGLSDRRYVICFLLCSCSCVRLSLYLLQRKDNITVAAVHFATVSSLL